MHGFQRQVTDPTRHADSSQHNGKTIEGVVAAIGIAAPMSEAVSRRGLHLARASDESFTLSDPVGFQPKTWVV